MRPEPQDVPLFNVELPAPLVKPRRELGPGKPRWSKYRVKDPLKCDDCNLVLHLCRGDGPASRRAWWRRKQGGVDLLLCIEHAQQRREEDGLKPLEKP